MCSCLCFRLAGFSLLVVFTRLVARSFALLFVCLFFVRSFICLGVWPVGRGWMLKIPVVEV